MNEEIEKFLNGRDLNMYGVWEVIGESENVGFSKSSDAPYIGTYEGKLEDVIFYSVSQPDFYTWGEGGTIKEIVIEKVNKEVLENNPNVQRYIDKKTKKEQEKNKKDLLEVEGQLKHLLEEKERLEKI